MARSDPRRPALPVATRGLTSARAVRATARGARREGTVARVDDTHEWTAASCTFVTGAASVRDARRFVDEVLVGWGVPAQAKGLSPVRLIVSELATNAVQHTKGASPHFRLDVRRESTDSLALGLTDAAPGRPQRLPAAVRQDNGRGMDIVRALLVEAGGRLSVAPTPSGGKTVWVTLPWAHIASQ